MSYSNLIQKLITAFCCLPGVGPKSAQRMVLHILEHHRKEGMTLSEVIAEAIDKVDRCSNCRMLTENKQCDICLSSKRDRKKICVVENPSDVFAIEQSGEYRGLYFVLLGNLSPIDGIGPNEIGINDLITKVNDEEIEELILATSTTVEGEATSFYIAEQLKDMDTIVTRIAYGVPMGGELEYVDGGTIARAFSGRSAI